MADTYETPSTTGEVNDMAWALANGMRAVQELERRARALVDSVDRTVEKIEASAEASVDKDTVIAVLRDSGGLEWQMKELAALTGRRRDEELS